MAAMNEKLSMKEQIALRDAIQRVAINARANAYRRPAFSTLLEEFAELVLSLRGKHDDPPQLELEQIGGIAINMLWQIECGYMEHVNNTRSSKATAAEGK